MVTQDDPNTHATARERQRKALSQRGDEASRGVFATVLGLGLVLAGAAAAAVAMFLPFVQPVDGLPVVGKNTVVQFFGWYVFLPLILMPYFGYRMSQGKPSAQWSLFGFCGLGVVGVVVLATDKELRTMRIMGPGGAADSTGPGIVASPDIAIYVAAAGVAVAIVGALALFQNARNSVRETRDLAASERHPRSEQMVLEADASARGAEAPAADALARTSGTRWRSSWPLAAAVVAVAVAVGSYFVLGRPSTPLQSRAGSQPPTSLTPAQTALQGLLLSPEQISTAMGTTELALKGTIGVMPNLAEQVPDEACRPIASPAAAEVYQGSGWNSLLGQVFAEPGPRFRHRVEQAVVSFPSAKEAGAFFTASAQSWPACADRHFTLVAMGTNMAHTAGPVSNTDGTLSITQNQDGVELTFSCQRALTVANNLVVDVMACSLKPTDAQFDVQVDSSSTAAIDIAHQIAAKVPAT